MNKNEYDMALEGLITVVSVGVFTSRHAWTENKIRPVKYKQHGNIDKTKTIERKI